MTDGAEPLWHRAHEIKFNHQVNKTLDRSRMRTMVDAKSKAALPSSFLIPANGPFPSVFDQGSLGSCVMCSLRALSLYNRMKSDPTPPDFSVLYGYRNARLYENNGVDPGDIGLTIPGAFESLKRTSFCEATYFPYIVSDYKKAPSAQANANAALYKMDSYWTIDRSLVELKTAITRGLVIVYGTEVYRSFMTSGVANTGLVPTPNPRVEAFQGGHAMVLVGYDDTRQAFFVMNHWSTEWGLAGFCWIPYNYVASADLSGDYTTSDSFRYLGDPSPAPTPAPAPAPAPTPAPPSPPVPTPAPWTSAVLEFGKIKQTTAFCRLVLVFYSGSTASSEVARFSWGGYVVFGSATTVRKTFDFVLTDRQRARLLLPGARALVMPAPPVTSTIRLLSLA